MYCAPVMAPAAAPLLGVSPAAIAYFVTVAYLGAMTGSAGAGAWVARFGPIRACQIGLGLCACGLALAATGTLPAVLAGALLIGLGYGPTNPASSVILARASPPGLIALTFSIKQSGVPLGTAIAGAAIPALLLALGWQAAALAAALVCVAFGLALSPLHARYDHERNAKASLSLAAAFAPVRFVLRHRPMAELALSSLVYAGIQNTLVAYLVTFLTDSFATTLVLAGFIMAASQLASVVARVLWGLLADKAVSRRAMLGFLGIGTGITTLFALAAGPQWPLWGLLAFAMALGATAVGWNGVFLAEVARLAPEGRISEATAGSTFFTFFGVVLMPPVFHFVFRLTSSYGVTYALFGALGLLAGVRLLATAKIGRDA